MCFTPICGLIGAARPRSGDRGFGGAARAPSRARLCAALFAENLPLEGFPGAHRPCAQGGLRTPLGEPRRSIFAKIKERDLQPLIILLRGVNVSGANKLPMAGFRAMLEGLGFTGVQTYIQSGNAVVLGKRAGAEVLVAEGLRSAFGLTVPVFVLTLGEVTAILAASPFAAEGEVDGARVHVVFLRGDVALKPGLEAFATRGERFHLGERAFYLHTPQGFGGSAVAEKLPRFLKAEMTARNQRSAAAILAMARGLTGT